MYHLLIISFCIVGFCRDTQKTDVIVSRIDMWTQPHVLQQGKSEGSDSCDRPSNLNLDSNRRFSARVTAKFDGWHRKTIDLYASSSAVQKVQKRLIRVEIGDILSRVTLKCDGWPWKKIEHLFYTTSSFVHHFKESVKSENAQFRSKLVIYVLCDIDEIWWMTLINNWAPLLYCITLCTSFQSHGGIQTEGTVRKRSIRVKIGNFWSCATLKFDNVL